MSGPLDSVTLHLVDSIDTLDECRRWAGQPREVLCADTESGGLNPHFHRHRLTQIGDLHHGWAFPPQWFGAANEILSRYTGRLGFFNSPYDWRVLAVQDGMTPRWERTDDAQAAGHIVDSGRVNRLKPRAAAEIDPRAMAGEHLLADGMRKQHWTWDTVPETWQPYWMYGALDPVLTAHLLHKYMPVVLSQYGPSYDLDMAYARLCANMMTAGMMIDQPYIHQRTSEVEAWAAEATSWLAREHGITSPSSNDQVGAALERAGVPILHRTAGGKPEIKKDTLALYAAQYPHAAGLIQTIVGAAKAAKITTLLGRFIESADSEGVVHYSIHPTGAMRTSRSSVTDPAMQTFDRDVPMIRGSYRPRPGHCFITIDADQIEARLVAALSGDPQMIFDFNEADRTGGHFFLTMASKIYGEQVGKKDKRYTMTKNATYAQFYGSGLEKAAITAGVSVEQMRPVYDGLRTLYPGTKQWSNRVINRAKRQRGRPYTATLMGRRLYGDRGKEYALVDYTVQGSAAEFLKAGAVRCDAAGLGGLMRLPIHDELLFEAPIGDAKEVLHIATEALTDRASYPVPFTWSGSILNERWVKA
jgi:DNA polymerase-1